MQLRQGVYSSLGGPCYETVSELRGLLQLGADAVGMSTAHEALVASYCGLKVLAIALITNKAVIEYDSENYPNHEEVIDTANKRAKDLEDLVMEFVSRLDLSSSDKNNNSFNWKACKWSLDTIKNNILVNYNIEGIDHFWLLSAKWSFLFVIILFYSF